MAKKTKDKNYRNFNNRKPFNNIPCKANEDLVPVVLTAEMRATLITAGLDKENIEKWRFPHAKERIPVAFVHSEKGHMEQAIKWFNDEAERYLKHQTDFLSGDLSLDKFIEEKAEEDASGFDPTGSTEYEDSAALMRTLGMLIDELAISYPQYAQIIKLLDFGYERKKLIPLLGKGKSQTYDLIKKAQQAGLKLYNEKYR